MSTTVDHKMTGGLDVMNEIKPRAKTRLHTHLIINFGSMSVCV